MKCNNCANCIPYARIFKYRAFVCFDSGKNLNIVQVTTDRACPHFIESMDKAVDT